MVWSGCQSFKLQVSEGHILVYWVFAYNENTDFFNLSTNPLYIGLAFFLVHSKNISD